MAITIEMPRLSDSMHEGIVLRWIKKIGDFVEVGDHLADIETEKAHVELQACEDGTLTEILVPEGATAAVGTPIALLQSECGKIQSSGRQTGGGSRDGPRQPARHRSARQNHGGGRTRRSP